MRTEAPVQSQLLERGPLPACPGARHTWIRLPTGIRAHVVEAGPSDGEPVLALHGWPQHWWMWRHLMPALAADGFRVISPDARGCGWSSAPPDRDFRKQRLVEDVCGLLDVMGLPSTAVVGHDWGGWVGFLLARQRPERVRRLMACSIVAPWRQAGAPERGDLRFAYQPLLAAPKLGPALAGRPRLVAAMMRRASAASFHWPAGALAAFADLARAPEVALSSSLLYRDFLTREVRALSRDPGPAAGLPMPVLQVLGTGDLVRSRLAPPPRTVDGWTVELVPGCGHFLFDERPAQSVAMARSFLAVR